MENTTIYQTNNPDLCPPRNGYTEVETNNGVRFYKEDRHTKARVADARGVAKRNRHDQKAFKLRGCPAKAPVGRKAELARQRRLKTGTEFPAAAARAERVREKALNYLIETASKEELVAQGVEPNPGPMLTGFERALYDLPDLKRRARATAERNAMLHDEGRGLDAAVAAAPSGLVSACEDSPRELARQARASAAARRAEEDVAAMMPPPTQERERPKISRSFTLCEKRRDQTPLDGPRPTIEVLERGLYTMGQYGYREHSFLESLLGMEKRHSYNMEISYSIVDEKGECRFIQDYPVPKVDRPFVLGKLSFVSFKQSWAQWLFRKCDVHNNVLLFAPHMVGAALREIPMSQNKETILANMRSRLLRGSAGLPLPDKWATQITIGSDLVATCMALHQLNCAWVPVLEIGKPEGPSRDPSFTQWATGPGRSGSLTRAIPPKGSMQRVCRTPAVSAL